MTDTAKPVLWFASPDFAEFANPWHDEIGRFAPKGTGTKVGFDGDAASDLHDEAMATLAAHADEMDEAYKVHYERGDESDSTFSQARDEYLGYGSRELDSQLRKNGVDKIASPAHRRALTDAVVMDEAINRSGFVFDDDVTLLRGIRNTGNRQFTEGTTFTDNGFVSVTASPGEAAQASGQQVRPAGSRPDENPGTIVALRIPGGTRAMPGSNNEQEWVLPRGGTYTVAEVIESPGSRIAVVDVTFPDSPPVTPGIPTIEDMMTRTGEQRERQRGLAASPGENLVYERLSWDLNQVTAQASVLRRMFGLIQQFANPWHDEIGRFAPKGTGSREGTREIRRPGGMAIAVAEEPGGVTVGETGGGNVEVRTGANGLVEVLHGGEWMPEHRGKTRLAEDGFDEAEIGAVIEAHRSSDSHRDANDAMMRGMKPPQRAIDALGDNVGRLKLADIGIEMADARQAAIAEATRGDPGTWTHAQSRGIGPDAKFIGTEADVEARPVREVVLGDNPNVVGDEEPLREGYPPRLYEVADNTYLIADGHHRVVMHNLLETPEFDALVLPFPNEEDEMTMFYGWGTEFANPWHDEQGRFAPKGTGKQSTGAPVAEPVDQTPNETKLAGRTSGADTTALANEVIDGMRFDENTQTWVSENNITIDPVDADDVIKQFANADVAVVDLTAVTVDGAPNMFSQMRANGRPRDQMPQITPDVQAEWWKTLDQDGIGYEQTKVDPATLAATQSELNGKKVGGMINAMQSGKMSLDGDPLLVSNDGHILDGHHRWAATAAMSADCGGCVEIPVIVIDMPMSRLLTYGLAWTDARGIPRAGVAAPSKRQAAGMSPLRFTIRGVEFAAKFPVTNPVKPGTEMPIFATDTEDGITDEDTANLPHGDGSAFQDGGEAPAEAPAAETAEAAVRPAAWQVTIPVSAETAAEFANPWHDEIGRFAPKGTGNKFVGGQQIPTIERDADGKIIVSDEAYELARPIYEQAQALEAGISRDLVSLVGDANPDDYEGVPPPQMYGFEYRYKSYDKIAEKIERVVEEEDFTREEAAQDIKDALRYTIHYPAGEFGPETQTLLNKLAEHNAYVHVKNTWPPNEKNPYKGVNVNVVTPEGFIYEVQFHTPRSQEVKDQMHEMYEESRVLPKGSERRVALETEMHRMANELEVPTGAFEIVTPPGQTLTEEIRRRLKLAIQRIRQWRLTR